MKRPVMSATRSDRDRGLTLTELLVTVIVMALVSTAVVGSIIAFFRIHESVTDRVTESRDLERLVDYLSADVASARVVFTDPSKMLTPCGTGDEKVLYLSWYEEFAGNEYTSRVTYWQNGGNGGELVRYKCENNGAAQRLVVAKVYNLFTVTQPLSSTGGAVLGTVELDFVQSTGTRRIVLSSRNYIPADEAGG